MSPSSRFRFGLFLAPFHRTDENPTVSFERDLELLQWLDRLGYDEAWIGEHHSAGWEPIAAPEIFIAVAAERTKHLKLGTGVVSLPYHHPLIVAERIVLLDHLTRGRVMFGVGPGALPSDAAMFGIDTTRMRPMMEESLDAIVRLFTETEPISVKTDWFELRNASLQVRPYQQPHPPLAVSSVQSPAGMALAGKHGAGVLSFGVFTGLRGTVNMKSQWQVAEEEAAKAGKTMDRREWRLIVPVYLAESRREAIEDVRRGSGQFVAEYQHRIIGRPLPPVPIDSIVDALVDEGSWIVGTPDDCVAAIERLQELTGGFGGLMVMVHEWASREKLLHSYELLARYVMPRVQGSLAGIQNSYRRTVENRLTGQQAMRRAIEQAHETYERGKGKT